MERERAVVSSVLGVLLLGALGFLIHHSHRFPGSGVGAVFGIAGAVLMLVPLAYPLAKRIPSLHARITRHVSLKALLAIHVYAGILGPALALIHTGHKFDSDLGISLTAVMLLTVVSGFTVRYLLSYCSHEITSKLLLLQTARGDLDAAWGALERSRGAAAVPKRALLFAGAAPSSFGLAGPSMEVVRIAESVADLEFAVRTHELLKRWFIRAVRLHIVFSVAFYLLLALHVGAGIFFGLRWLR